MLSEFRGGSENIQGVDDDAVIRKAHYWSPAVRNLLLWLEEQNFPYSPKHLGIVVGDQTERLGLIKGDSGKNIWERIITDEGLRAHARLLRAYHDAVQAYRPTGKILWAFGEQELQSDEIICHNDFGPWNTVWDAVKPVGIIDWDLAAPGKPIDDIAYALEYAAPFRDDKACLEWHHFREVPNRKRRAQVFLEAYGIGWINNIADEVTRVQRRDVDRVIYLASKGLEPQKSWIKSDYMDELAQRIDWTERNKGLFT